MSYYLGIDGGGSKTKAVLCDGELNMISSFTGKSINFNSVGFEAARKNLIEIADAVLDKNIKPDAVCIGCAALSSRADEVLTEKLCGGIFNCENIILDSDLFIALEAMNASGSCAVAVCGTGSMAAGRLPDKTVIHTGGFGYLLGDEGSGYAISADAIRAVLRADEKSAPETALAKAAEKYFGTAEPDSLIDFVYSEPVPVKKIAGFAPAVSECAENGDAVAHKIIKNNAEAFADTVCALLRRMPKGIPLGLWGGIMQNCAGFRSIFINAVKRDFPETEISILGNPPEIGAVIAAMKAGE